MIHRIKFSNFYSFDDEQTIDFVVNENAPDTEAYVRTPFGERVSKVLVVYGHNASGKTNLIKVISFIRWLLVYSFEKRPEEQIFFDPFFLRKEAAPGGEDLLHYSEIQVEFEVAAELFRYTVRFNVYGIAFEQLDIRRRGRKNFIYVFMRKFNLEKNEYEIKINSVNKKAPRFHLPKEFEAPRKRRNASIISIGAQVSERLCERIRNYWSNGFVNAIATGRQDIKNIDGLQLATNIFKEDPQLFEKAKTFLRDCDLGLSDIEIQDASVLSENGKEKKINYPFGVHYIGNRSELFPFRYESDGTVGLYMYLSQILLVLKNGAIAAIDEIDADLHPMTIPKVLDLFLSRDSNPHHSQLICTCHSTPLLSHLDKYQVLLVEKDENFASQVWRLDDIKGIRPDDNLYGKYMAGAYGAVPDF